MVKSRFFYLSDKTNSSKLQVLEELHQTYKSYLQSCVNLLIQTKTLNLSLSQLKDFFPPSNLSSHIQRNCRIQAVSIISSWAKAVYQSKLKRHIRKLLKSYQITELEAKSLHVIGKHLITIPWKFITQEHLNLYLSLLFDENISGRIPQIKNSAIRLSCMTSSFEDSEESKEFNYWIRLGTLNKGHTISLPLSSNPYIKSSKELRKNCSFRKDKKGGWRVEVAEKKEYELPEISNPEYLGIDVGFNCLAATSDGQILGSEFKSIFNKKRDKILKIRNDRKNQGLLEDSPRISRLEFSLTEFIKTTCRTIVNKLILNNPNTIFVIEDLDLQGTYGQKRSRYKEIHHALEQKAHTLKVNPAYTSQTCPRCGYVSSKNRSGINFRCKACGFKSHADWVGSINILGRSKMKNIGTDDDPSEVKEVLDALYLARRSKPCSQDFLEVNEPLVFGQLAEIATN